MCEDDLREALRRESESGRRHTGDLSWHDRSPGGKGLVERAWCEALIEEQRRDGQSRYENAVISEDEWPDCEAATVDSGARVAMEVSEVVRGVSLAPGGQRGPWTPAEFIGAVQHRISEKDARGFHGEKYDEYVVLLHTDELFLVEEWVGPALEGVSFGRPHGTIDTAFLILGYRHGRRAYIGVAEGLVDDGLLDPVAGQWLIDCAQGAIDQLEGPFSLAANGVTVVCTAAAVGETGMVAEVEYTKPFSH